MIARKKRRQLQDAWGAARRYGCDMALLEANLQMTPRGRVRAHRHALALAEKLQLAMQSRDERSRNAA